MRRKLETSALKKRYLKLKTSHLLLGANIIITALITGCSSVPVATPTPYKSANSKQSYGYSSEKLGEGEYRILFKASDRTPADKVQQYALRRAAEIAKQNDFSYVAVTKTNITKKRVLAREVSLNTDEPVVFPSDKQCTMSGCSNVAQPSTTVDTNDIEKTAMKDIYFSIVTSMSNNKQMLGANAFLVSDLLSTPLDEKNKGY
ncbi:CC0125/CC1285 family lipoprotein [Alteromonas sp. A081]|uniref:CC0125/CC1285 family lipoprotein n=1 Tax=Alteromonas sp. A081 TaxID=3410269 RepID=UPI003B9867C9